MTQAAEGSDQEFALQVQPIASEDLGAPRGAVHPTFVARFVKRRGPTVAAVFLLGLCVLAIAAPYLPWLDPDGVHLEHVLGAPSWGHLLGYDNIGRDVVSRLIFSSRVSLVAAGIAVVVALVIGLPLGLISGYFGGWCDILLARMFEVLMSLPALILAIVIVSILRPGLVSAMVAIGIVIAPAFYRVARAATLDVRSETFIEAARVSQASTLRILTRHILPNISGPLLIQIALTMGVAIVVEAALSFIGLGVQLPQASWGSMLRQASSFLGNGPLAFVLSPGVVIVAVVLAFNTVADGLRASIGAEQLPR